MTKINFRDFYPWYNHDEYTEVSDAVAEELLADKRYQKAHMRRMYRNKAHYSLDAGDGIENAAIFAEPSPHEILGHKQWFHRLCIALNSLPPTQGKRIEAHYILGMSITDIALVEGVSKAAIGQSIERGLQNMWEHLKNFR